jgi:transcriptional regulator with XRE-family HTH domain
MEETRGDYPFPESGLPNVVLLDIPLLKCPDCRQVEPLIPRAKHLIRALAQAVLHKPAKLCGAEIRYLRKHIGWKAVELARLMGVDKTTISKWENDQDLIGPQSDRLLRSLVRYMIEADKLHQAALKAQKEKRYSELFDLIEKDYRETRHDYLSDLACISRRNDPTCARLIVEERDGEYHAVIE